MLVSKVREDLCSVAVPLQSSSGTTTKLLVNEIKHTGNTVLMQISIVYIIMGALSC